MLVVETRKRVLGQEHPDTLNSMASLALVYRGQQRWKEAELMEEQVRETRMRVLGHDHPDSMTSMVNSASTSDHSSSKNGREEFLSLAKHENKEVV